jgi:uncharacterized phage infection (PIP) family protein YhgE
MANEEMQNTIQFILDQQAQLTVNLDKLGEKVEKIAEKVEKIAEAQVAYERRTSRLEESFQVLVQLAANMDGRMDTISANTDRRINALTAAQERTGQQLAQTDSKLNALIGTVERYISEGRNGRS